MQRTSDTTQGAGLAAEERRRGRARQYADMLVLIRGLARRHKNLVNRISKAELNASFIEYELFQLLKMMGSVSTKAPKTSRAMAPRPRSLKRKRSRAGRFAISPNRGRFPGDQSSSGRYGDIRIDGGKQFTLPPTLADLMTALSIDNGLSDDAFVGWKTVGEIAEYLARRSGKPVTKRAITQNVYRLRKELFDRGGVNPSDQPAARRQIRPSAQGESRDQKRRVMMNLF